MKVDITRAIKETIDISKEDAKNIVLNYIYDEFGITPLMFIKDQKLMIKLEYTGSHKWTDDEIIRDASDEDKIILDAVKLIASKDHK
jgi:hypothetical protein